jgi:hypothetical protein
MAISRQRWLCLNYWRAYETRVIFRIPERLFDRCRQDIIAQCEDRRDTRLPFTVNHV